MIILKARSNLDFCIIAISESTHPSLQTYAPLPGDLPDSSTVIPRLMSTAILKSFLLSTLLSHLLQVRNDNLAISNHR